MRKGLFLFAPYWTLGLCRNLLCMTNSHLKLMCVQFSSDQLGGRPLKSPFCLGGWGCPFPPLGFQLPPPPPHFYWPNPGPRSPNRPRPRPPRGPRPRPVPPVDKCGQHPPCRSIDPSVLPRTRMVLLFPFGGYSRLASGQRLGSRVVVRRRSPWDLPGCPFHGWLVGQPSSLSSTRFPCKIWYSSC